MLIILISFLQVRLLTVTDDHPVQHSLAVGGTPSLLLAAKTSQRAQWHAKWVTTLAPNTLGHTSPLLGSGDANEAFCPSLWTNVGSATVPARYEISYWIQYPQQTCSILKQVYKMMDRRPNSPCPLSTFQAPCHSQGKRSSSAKCCHKVYLTLAALSLREPLDTFQLLSRASEMK